MTGHKKFVGPVVWVPAGKIADAPNGAIVSGGFDGLLVAWDAVSCSQLWSLQGHTIQVRKLECGRLDVETNHTQKRVSVLV